MPGIEGNMQFILTILFGGASFIIASMAGIIGFLIKCSIDKLNDTIEELVETTNKLNGRMLAIEYKTATCPHVGIKEECDGNVD